MQNTNIAIIGAGPYGLSLAAHLSARGMDFRIYGEPMESWRKGMPKGMSLKSDGWSSSLYNPGAHFTLAEFCEKEKIPYHDSQTPVAIETFVSYGMAFQKRFAPQVERKRLVALGRDGDRFGLRFDDETSISADKVVLAVGVHSFDFVPHPLVDLPKELISHSGEHGPLEQFKGKHVTVVGSGASAIDLAALLHEQGSDVLLAARTNMLRFGTRSRLNPSVYQKIKSPRSGIGGGWTLKICADAPAIFHALPQPIRLHLVKSELGPSGGWFMKQRVLGRVRLSLGYSVRAAKASGGKVRLELQDNSGGIETVTTDHVIAATGYRIDMRRLGFLGAGMLHRLRLVEMSPVLSRNYETSIPGLHVVGFASAYSFGPVARFVYGAIHPASRLAEHLAPHSPRQTTAMRLAETG